MDFPFASAIGFTHLKSQNCDGDTLILKHFKLEPSTHFRTINLETSTQNIMDEGRGSVTVRLEKKIIPQQKPSKNQNMGKLVISSDPQHALYLQIIPYYPLLSPCETHSAPGLGLRYGNDDC